MSEAEFTITLAQLNPTVGDVTGNAAKARAAREKAREAGADLMVLPELFICGYPPEDLVLKPALQAACRAAVEELARETADGGPAVLIGTPWVEDGKLYNACALLDEGRIAALRFKANLPNYGVFDEKRLFARGPAAGPVTVKGIRVGVPICEDIWLEESEDYENVVECLAETGAEILVVPNGSPYARDKNDVRLSIAVARVTESGLPLIYLNEVGGQDELVFDGASFALNADLTVAAQLPAFEQSITTLRWTRSDAGWRCNGPVAELPEGDKGDYAACVLGLRDYVRKNGFPGVLLGVSGGIDFGAVRGDGGRRAWAPIRSAASCCRSASPRRCRWMTRQSSPKALGIRYEVLPIADAVNGFEKILSGLFAGLPRDITEENLQARTRGTLLMAISNKTGAMVVTTGNKSEMSVGYATLYGDMNGGFNPIKDIYKTEVFRLSSVAQFAGSRRARSAPRARSSRTTSSPGRRRRNCAKTRPTRIRCRPTRSWMRSWNGWSSASSRWPRSSPPGLTARRWRASIACSTSPNTSDGRPRRASRSRRRILAATAAIPSPTAFAISASRCPNRTTSW